MTNDDWNDDNNDGQNNNSAPKALRDHLKKVEQELADEKASKAELIEFKRQTLIGTVLKEKGFNPKAAAFIPASVDTDQVKLEAWLTEHSELLPKAAQTGTSNEEPPAGEADDTDVDDDDRMNRAAQMGLPLDRARDVGSRIDAAKTPEDMDKIMAELKNVRMR